MGIGGNDMRGSGLSGVRPIVPGPNSAPSTPSMSSGSGPLLQGPFANPSHSHHPHSLPHSPHSHNQPQSILPSISAITSPVSNSYMSSLPSISAIKRPEFGQQVPVASQHHPIAMDIKTGYPPISAGLPPLPKSSPQEKPKKKQASNAPSSHSQVSHVPLQPQVPINVAPSIPVPSPSPSPSPAPKAQPQPQSQSQPITQSQPIRVDVTELPSSPHAHPSSIIQNMANLASLSHMSFTVPMPGQNLMSRSASNPSIAVAQKEPLASPVDFSKFDIPVLKRYKKQYKLKTRHNSTKAELVAAISRHFQSQEVKDSDVISFFLYSVKNQDKIMKLKGRRQNAVF